MGFFLGARDGHAHFVEEGVRASSSRQNGTPSDSFPSTVSGLAGSFLAHLLGHGVQSHWVYNSTAAEAFLEVSSVLDADFVVPVPVQLQQEIDLFQRLQITIPQTFDDLVALQDKLWTERSQTSSADSGEAERERLAWRGFCDSNSFDPDMYKETAEEEEDIDKEAKEEVVRARGLGAEFDWSSGRVPPEDVDAVAKAKFRIRRERRERRGRGEVLRRQEEVLRQEAGISRRRLHSKIFPTEALVGASSETAMQYSRRRCELLSRLRASYAARVETASFWWSNAPERPVLDEWLEEVETTRRLLESLSGRLDNTVLRWNWSELDDWSR